MTDKKDKTGTGADTTSAPTTIDHSEQQRAKVREAVGGDTDPNEIREGEYAAKLAYDIEGGLGAHKEGTIIRNLSESAFITLTQGGGHDVIKPGTKVTDKAVDASAPIG